jgi:quercetin dioxygenase-like cupin family protein
VLEGRLSLELEGSGPKLLHPGDGAYYPGDRPHRFRNADDKSALRLICVDSPPPLNRRASRDDNGLIPVLTATSDPEQGS